MNPSVAPKTQWNPVFHLVQKITHSAPAVMDTNLPVKIMSTPGASLVNQPRPLKPVIGRHFNTPHSEQNVIALHFFVTLSSTISFFHMCHPKKQQI